MRGGGTAVAAAGRRNCTKTKSLPLVGGPLISILVKGYLLNQQDYISPGAPAPNKNLIQAILCRVIDLVLG